MSKNTIWVDKDKKYKISREDVEDILTWAFLYKNKVTSRKFIWTVAYKSNIWLNDILFTSRMKGLSNKLGLNDILEMSNKNIKFANNIEIIKKLSDNDIMKLTKALIVRANKKQNNLLRKQLWVINKVIDNNLNKGDLKTVSQYDNDTIMLDIGNISYKIEKKIIPNPVERKKDQVLDCVEELKNILKIYYDESEDNPVDLLEKFITKTSSNALKLSKDILVNFLSDNMIKEEDDIQYWNIGYNIIRIAISKVRGEHE